MHVLRTQDLENPYVISDGESVQHFRSAHVAGSTKGSLAFTGLPCRDVKGIITGYRATSLTGAVGSATPLGCPNGPIVAFGVRAKGVTQWSLASDVWGSTSSSEQVDSAAGYNTFSPGDLRPVEVNGPF